MAGFALWFPFSEQIRNDETLEAHVPFDYAFTLGCVVLAVVLLVQGLFSYSTFDPVAREVRTRLLIRESAVSFDDVVAVRVGKRLLLELADGAPHNMVFMRGYHVVSLLMPKAEWNASTVAALREILAHGDALSDTEAESLARRE